jgi:hypothetical protein
MATATVSTMAEAMATTNASGRQNPPSRHPSTSMRPNRTAPDTHGVEARHPADDGRSLADRGGTAEPG